MRVTQLRSSLVFVLLAGLAGVALGRTEPPPSVPDTPAGKALGAFLSAVGSSDPGALKAFHEAFAPADRRGKPVDPGMLERGAGLRERTGGLELVAIGSSRPLRIETEVRARKGGETFVLAIEVEPEAPHGLDGIELRPGKLEKPLAGVDDLAVKSLDDLGRYLDGVAAADRFSGTVLVASPGREPWVKAVGLADRAADRPVTAATRFHLGSMNKMFTAVAVMQLVEAGKLRLDDPVGKVLPSYPNAQVRDQVTVCQLLTHSSGLGSYWNDRFRERRTSIRTVADYLALFSDEAPEFPPGKEFRYSNSGYIVLGAIAERVSGLDYYEYVRRNVFARAGMNDTAYPTVAEHGTAVAVGYTRDGGPLGPNTATLPNRGGPAGGGVSTVGDLLRFGRALLAGDLVSKETLARMTTPSPVGPKGGFGYGFGFGVMGDGASRSFGHNGGAPGMAAELRVYPASGAVLAVLSNRDPGGVEPVVRRAEPLATGGTAAPPAGR